MSGKTVLLVDDELAPPRLEDIEPVMAEFFRQVAHDEHPTVKSVYFNTGTSVFNKSVFNKRPKPTVGRNDPCPCGSGKKHKKCCG